MSPDCRELQHVEGAVFVADSTSTTRDWVEKYIPPEDRARIWSVIEHAIRTKAVLELEHRLIGEDGSVRWIFSRAVPIEDEKGDITECVGCARDVTRE